MSRTRSRDTYATPTSSGYTDVYDDGSTPSFGPFAGFYQSMVESITDETNNPQSENNCSHERWWRTHISHNALPQIRLASPHSHIRRTIGADFVPVHIYQECAEHAQASLPGVPGNFDSTALQLAQDMWSSVRPSFQGDFSAINFLLELKDMAQIMDLYKRFRSAWQARKDLSKRHRRNKADRIDRLASAAVLQYQFGIKPFMSDVSSFLTQLTRFNERVKAMIKGERKTHRKHVKWFRDNSYPVDQSGIATAANGGMPGSVVDRAFQRLPYVVSGTFVYNYTLPDAGGWRTKVGGFLDAFGVNLNPAIIWNAIPFSFVVDWVFDVSKWLNSIRMESSGILVRLEQCSVSCKAESSVSYTLRWPQANYTHTGFVVKRKGYRRVVLDPALVQGAISPRWRTPSGNAVVSASALGHQLSGTGQRTGRLDKQLGRVPLLR